MQYYTGQLFDMKSIVAASHEVGAFCGLDLAHAVGNVELFIHDWEVFSFKKSSLIYKTAKFYKI